MSLRRSERYNFSNRLPVPREPERLPVERPAAGEISPPDAGHIVPSTPRVVHYHQAPPDRTLQRVALGAGVGAGAVAAGVYFAPMLIVLVQSLVIGLITIVVGLAIACCAIVAVVGAFTGRGRR